MYTVTLRQNTTGRTVKVEMDLDWEEGSDYWWSDGNFGCDCNREILFLGEIEEEFNMDEIQCSEGRYDVLSILLPDGRDIAPLIEGLNSL